MYKNKQVHVRGVDKIYKNAKTLVYKMQVWHNVLYFLPDLKVIAHKFEVLCCLMRVFTKAEHKEVM